MEEFSSAETQANFDSFPNYFKLALGDKYEDDEFEDSFSKCENRFKQLNLIFNSKITEYHEKLDKHSHIFYDLNIPIPKAIQRNLEMYKNEIRGALTDVQSLPNFKVFPNSSKMEKILVEKKVPEIPQKNLLYDEFNANELYQQLETSKIPKPVDVSAPDLSILYPLSNKGLYIPHSCDISVEDLLLASIMEVNPKERSKLADFTIPMLKPKRNIPEDEHTYYQNLNFNDRLSLELKSLGIDPPENKNEILSNIYLNSRNMKTEKFNFIVNEVNKAKHFLQTILIKQSKNIEEHNRVCGRMQMIRDETGNF